MIAIITLRFVFSPNNPYACLICWYRYAAVTVAWRCNIQSEGGKVRVLEGAFADYTAVFNRLDD